MASAEIQVLACCASAQMKHKCAGVIIHIACMQDQAAHMVPAPSAAPTDLRTAASKGTSSEHFADSPQRPHPGRPALRTSRLSAVTYQNAFVAFNGIIVDLLHSMAAGSAPAIALDSASGSCGQPQPPVTLESTPSELGRRSSAVANLQRVKKQFRLISDLGAIVQALAIAVLRCTFLHRMLLSRKMV